MRLKQMRFDSAAVLFPVFVMVRDYFYHLKINANDDLMLAAA